MSALRIAALFGAAIGIRSLWEMRDREQVEALMGVVRKRPVLYRVTLNREPMVRIHGDHARIVGVNLSNYGTGIHVGKAE